MLKRIMLLGAAVAALIAVAAPAAQAEYEWHTNGFPIATHDFVSFEGDIGVHLTPVTAGYHATLEATMTLKAGTLEIGQPAGEVIEAHISKCKGTSGLNGTTCTSTSTGVSWPAILVAQNTLELEVSLHQLFWANPDHTGPPTTTTQLTGGVTVEFNPASVTQFTLTTGTGLTLNGKAATIQGILGKTGANALTIS